MPVSIQLRPIAREDALGWLRHWLQEHFPDRGAAGRFEFSTNDVIDQTLAEQQADHRAANPQGMIAYIRDPLPNSDSFHHAVWELCARGVARPKVKRSPQGNVLFTGLDFVLTEYGESWVAEVSPTEVIPSETGRFAAVLASYQDLFGPAYHARSQEALTCYQAHAFLACCTMTGAAAEAILVRIATIRVGDAQQVLRRYRGMHGRSWVENQVTAGLRSNARSQVAAFTGLLKYWRDDAPHGADSRLTEQEAFTGMLTLLRFAVFAHGHWMELTGTT